MGIYGAIATGIDAGNIFKMQPPSTPGGDWTTTYLYQFAEQVPFIDLMDKNGTLYGNAQTETGPAFLETIFALATQ